MKYLIIDENINIKNIIFYLNNKLGLPRIHRRLNIFSTNDDMQVEILDNNIYYVDDSKKKFNFIKNKNLKTFFKYIQNNNTCGFYINDIVLLTYDGVDFVFDTYHGNIIKTNNSSIIHYLSKKYNLQVYNNINDHKMKVELKTEYLFDEIGNFNPKIRNYANKVGLDIRSTSASLKVRLSNISNDYSYIEKYYSLIMDSSLLTTNFNNKYQDMFKEMSIIIPVYNQDVVPTLLSIQGQNISLSNKKKIQVIVIADGCKTNVFNRVKTVKNMLNFEVDVITLNENKGLSNARNVGLALAKYNLLLFIDSDIILSKDYLSDLNTRLQIIPNSIIVAMRKNIDKNDPLISSENLLKGVERTLEFDDSRVITNSKKYHIGWDKAYNGEEISVLNDTNYFKELSFGSKIGIYDLASVVTGHNIGVNKNMLRYSKAFCTEFKGWGLEDSYFAAQLIADGSYVIPMMSSCVYHQKHPPRSGNMKKKQEEAAKNYQIYQTLLDEPWD